MDNLPLSGLATIIKLESVYSFTATSSELTFLSFLNTLGWALGSPSQTCSLEVDGLLFAGPAGRRTLQSRELPALGHYKKTCCLWSLKDISLCMPSKPLTVFKVAGKIAFCPAEVRPLLSPACPSEYRPVECRRKGYPRLTVHIFSCLQNISKVPQTPTPQSTMLGGYSKQTRPQLLSQHPPNKSPLSLLLCEWRMKPHLGKFENLICATIVRQR